MDGRRSIGTTASLTLLGPGVRRGADYSARIPGTPATSSHLANPDLFVLVELWLSAIDRGVIARGVFTSITDLKQ